MDESEKILEELSEIIRDDILNRLPILDENKKGISDDITRHIDKLILVRIKESFALFQSSLMRNLGVQKPPKENITQ